MTAVPKDNQRDRCLYIISRGKQIEEEYLFRGYHYLMSDKGDAGPGRDGRDFHNGFARASPGSKRPEPFI